MYFRLTQVLRTFFYFSLIFWAMSSGYPLNKPVAKGEGLKTFVPPQTSQPAKDKKDTLSVPADKNETQTLKEKAVDKAGEKIGNSAVRLL